MRITMKSFGSFVLIVCAILLTAPRAGAALSYTAIDLGPGSAAYGVSGGEQVGEQTVLAQPKAALWSGSAQSLVSLDPAQDNFLYSTATGVSNGQQVGYGASGQTGSIGVLSAQALLWNGSAESAVILTPSGFQVSQGLGIFNGQEVGSAGNPQIAATPAVTHAMLWSGSAASAVDLNPSWSVYSVAYGIDNGQQVGLASTTGSTTSAHAVLWTGSAASAVDLNPGSFASSQATAVSNGQQVGFASASDSPNFLSHAILWSGSASSAVDLNPSGFSASEALAISNGQEVGFGTMGQENNALLWSGSAASVVDLQQFLPASLTSSEATGIDANGDIVGFALNPAMATQDAVIWVPQSVPQAIPLPAAVWTGLTMLVLIAAAFRRRALHSRAPARSVRLG